MALSRGKVPFPLLRGPIHAGYARTLGDNRSGREWVSIIVALRDPPGDQQQTHVQQLLKRTHPHSVEPVGALPGDDPSLQGMLYNTPGSLRWTICLRV